MLSEDCQKVQLLIFDFKKMSQTTQKILYVVPYFVPAWSYGGPVKVTYDFARELAGLGYEVTVATTDVLDKKSRNKILHENMGGIDVVRFKNISNRTARSLNFYTPIGFKGWLKQNISKFDIVHIHEFFTYQTAVTSKICRKFKKPYLIQPHGSLSEFCRKSRFYFIKKLLVENFKSLVASSSAIVALNDQEKEDIAKIYPDATPKVRIVSNGLDLTEFKGVKAKDLHKTYKIPSEDKIIAFIGRIHFKKGLDISLEALSQIKNKLKFTFLIIGPDEGEMKNLEALAKSFGIEDRLVFTGLISGQKKLETLKGADLSLLNSRSEGLPTTLLESAALGLPIICSTGANFPEVSQFKAGFVVSNTNQTAESLIKVLTNDGLQKRMSQNALNLAARFDLIKCTRILSRIYQSAL